MSHRQASDQQIRKMLITLHDELERTRTINPEERAMLRHLMSDIQEMLQRPDEEITPDSPHYQANQNFLDRMESSIELLEADHPALRVMIEKALDTLNIAGI